MSARDHDGALPRIISEPLGGGALARAAQSDAPPPFYETRPATPAAWTQRAAAVRADVGRDWLDAIRPALGDTIAASAAGARLARSAEGRGVVVTTGQQPGLFGGPIYTWSKALGALALADALERATGTPTAPVFWAATDDADFAEASVTRVAVGAELLTLRISQAGPDGVPMSAVPLADDVAPALDALARAAGSAAYARALDVVRGAYTAGRETVGSAYVRLLRELLEPLGVAVLDASHPAVRGATDPLLRRALRGAADVERALAARDAAITAARFAVQVPSVAGLSLVFASDASGAKERVRTADAARVAETAAAGALGPNVLLRPVVERAILPTVAYVAGPGELAYFAQVGAVADALGVARPLAVPRWSCTILEPHVARALARRGLEPHDLADPHAAEGRVARESMPAEVSDALANLRGAVEQGLDRLAASASRAGGAPLVPNAALEGSRRSLEVRLDRLERRFVAAAKRVGSEALRDVALARTSLYPEGVRQERSLNFMPLLARYGPPLLDEMRTAAAAHARQLAGDASSVAASPGTAAAAGLSR